DPDHRPGRGRHTPMGRAAGARPRPVPHARRARAMALTHRRPRAPAGGRRARERREARMTKKIRIELNSKGIIDTLKSREVAAELRRRADRVRDRAGADDHAADVWTGFDRARATVRTTTAKGARAQASNRNLTRALDAARGE